MDELQMSMNFCILMTWPREKDGTSGQVVLKPRTLVEIQGRRADSNVVEREARQQLVVLAIKAGTRETGQDNTTYQKLFFGMRLQVSNNVVLKT